MFLLFYYFILDDKEWIMCDCMYIVWWRQLYSRLCLTKIGYPQKRRTNVLSFKKLIANKSRNVILFLDFFLIWLIAKFTYLLNIIALLFLYAYIFIHSFLEYLYCQCDHCITICIKKQLLTEWRLKIFEWFFLTCHVMV